MTRATFIRALQAAWDAAAAAVGGARDDDFVIAGARLRLRFAGQAMREALTPALAHARRPVSGVADLTVLVWDAASTGVGMPPPPWPRASFGAHGRIVDWFDEELQATYHWGSGSLSLIEPERGVAVFCSRSASSFPFFERAAPLRTMLHGWLASRGLQLAHAAVVCGPRGCALLAGPAGAGKSSTMLACLHSGLGHLADDFCVLEAGRPTIAHSLYSSVKAHPDTLERLGVPTGLVANPEREPGDKAVVFLARHAPEVLVADAPVRAIVLPVIRHAPDTRTVRGSCAAALAALVPSTMLQLPGTDAGTMRRLSDLVRTVPCHRLEVGTDAEQIPRRLSELLA